jgi:hypothetical protein
MSLLAIILFSILLHETHSLQQYGHAYNVPGDFTSAEYATIASTFPIFTIEKRHAYEIYGNSSAPYPFKSNSIAASIGTARKIKALNASVRVLMYWNSALHWNFYECEADVQPSWLLPPKHGYPAAFYNYSVPDFRAWWVACAIGALRNSSGALDGLFIDAVNKVNSYDVWGEMMDAIRAAVPHAFLIYNGDGYNHTDIVAANSSLLRHADAVYLESTARLITDAVKDPPSIIIPYLQYLAASAAADATKLFFGKGLLNAADPTDPKTFTFGLAVFLLITPNPSTSYFISNYGYSIDQGVLLPHTAYALSYGMPLGDFSVNGAVLTRNFTNATVVVDLSTQSASIAMGLSFVKPQEKGVTRDNE